MYPARIAGARAPAVLELGVEQCQLGLRQFRYRTWLLPIGLANPVYHDRPLGFEEALERVNPGVILVDRHIDELMTEASSAENPNHLLHVGFEAFKARHHARLTCVIRDGTYGTMQVYLVPEASFR